MNEKCPRCGYEWNYKGRMKLRRTCPSCGYSYVKKTMKTLKSPIFTESDKLLKKGLMRGGK